MRCKHCKRVLTWRSSLPSSYKNRSLVHSSKWRPTLSATSLCFSIHAYSNLCILYGLCSWACWICFINSTNRCGCLIVIAIDHPFSFCQLYSSTDVNSTRQFFLANICLLCVNIGNLVNNKVEPKWCDFDISHFKLNFERGSMQKQDNLKKVSIFTLHPKLMTYIILLDYCPKCVKVVSKDPSS